MWDAYKLQKVFASFLIHVWAAVQTLEQSKSSHGTKHSQCLPCVDAFSKGKSQALDGI